MSQEGRNGRQHWHVSIVSETGATSVVRHSHEERGPGHVHLDMTYASFTSPVMANRLEARVSMALFKRRIAPRRSASPQSGASTPGLLGRNHLVR